MAFILAGCGERGAGGAAAGGSGATSLPQCSLPAPAGLRCASERLLDGEQGLRIQRCKFSSRRTTRRGALQGSFPEDLETASKTDEIQSELTKAVEEPREPAVKEDSEPKKALRWFWQQDEADTTRPNETAKEREEAALLKAKAGLAFNWPWQKESIVQTPSSDAEEMADKTDGAAEAESPSTIDTSLQIEIKLLSVIQDEETTEDDLDRELESNGRPASMPSPDETEKPVEPTATSVSENTPASVPQEETLDEKAGAAQAAPEKDEVKPVKPDTVQQFDPEKVRERELESLVKAKAATSFVWPWRRTETVEEQVAQGEQTEVIQAESLPVVKSRPLSPYPGYPDWKPPASPSPRPPVIMTAATSSDVKPVETKSEVEPVETGASSDSEIKPEMFTASMVREREQAALAKAKAAISWSNWTLSNSAISNETLLEPKQEVTTSAVPVFEPVVTSRPVSPYYRFEDSKPPASPMPTSSVALPKESSEKASEKSQAEPVVKADAPDVPAASSDNQIKPEEFTASMVREREQAALAKAKAALSWSSWKSESNLASNQTLLELKHESITTSVAPVPEQPAMIPAPLPSPSPSRPLSPYYRYEELKPPASPMPRPPTSSVVLKEVSQTTMPQTSSDTTPDADAVDEAATEALDKAKASIGIKWPWL